MNEPAALRPVTTPPETLAARSARLQQEAQALAAEALRVALDRTEALQTDFAALASLNALAPGLREEARQMAKELRTRGDNVRVIINRLGN